MGAFELRIATKDVDRGGPIVSENRSPGTTIHLDLGQDRAVANWYKQVGNSARTCLGGVTVLTEFTRLQVEHGSQFARVRWRWPECREGRGRQLHERQLPLSLGDSDLDQAGFFLQNNVGSVAGEWHGPNRGKKMTCPDRRVAGERQLFGGSEDPEPPRISRIPRRPHEDRLRKIELGRDPLHLLLRQLGRFREHRELVPAEGTIGEDIEGVKMQSFRHGYRIPDKSKR